MSFRRSIALVGAAMLLSAACSFEQEHGYVQSADGSLSFRHPAEWRNLQLEPIGLEWVAGIDGSPEPSSENLQAPFVQDPVVLAEVRGLDPLVRDDASLRSLRLLSLADHPDPRNDESSPVRLLFDENFVDEHGFEGHHMRFEVDSDEGTTIEEHLAVFAPDRGRIHHLWVACSMTCFNANTGDIDDVFASVELRP